MKECLNCGTLISEGMNYCHHCGQRVSVKRLTGKSVTISIFSGLTRINKGVLYTCYCLLLRPWRVISNYIKGRRIRYINPIQLLLILTFLTMAISSLYAQPNVSNISEDYQLFKDYLFFNIILNKIIKFLHDSVVVQYLLIFVPVIPALNIITREHGQPKYNFAELLLASIYMSDAVLILQLIVGPLDTYLPTSSTFLTYGYILIIGTMGIYKTQMRLKRKRLQLISKIILFFLITISIYLLVLIIPLSIAYWFIKG